MERCASRGHSAPASRCRTRSRSWTCVDEVSPAARRAGAVNTIINRGGALFGDNTDIYGFGITVSDGPVGARLPVGRRPGGWRGGTRGGPRVGSRREWPRSSSPTGTRTRGAARAGPGIPHRCASTRLDEEFLPRELPRAELLVNATSLGWHRRETPIALSRLRSAASRRRRWPT